jgi:hypothetical protein
MKGRGFSRSKKHMQFDCVELRVMVDKSGSEFEWPECDKLIGTTGLM